MPPPLNIKIIFCAFENRVSQKVAPKSPYAYSIREEGEFFAVYNMSALKKAKKRGNRRLVGRFPLKFTTNNFVSSKLFAGQRKIYHQYRDVRGVHAGNASRLAEIFGADLVQLLPRLQPKPVDLFVIDIGGQLFIF